MNVLNGLFLSTLSLRRATYQCKIDQKSSGISIHALLAESDNRIRHRREKPRHFYPRSPCGERQRANSLPHTPPHISIHALLAESDRVDFFFACCIIISIHALLAESDIKISFLFRLPKKFLSTLSLRRATIKRLQRRAILNIFLSTLSLRRATWARGSRVTYVEISIHALLAESDHLKKLVKADTGISIHALLAESDLKTPCVRLSIEVFLSTLSLRRATPEESGQQRWLDISIHALLAESDF